MSDCIKVCHSYDNGCAACLKEENKKLRTALEDIIDSKECEVCKCSQYAGKTYDGLSFVILQKMAKRALKNEY